MSDLWDIFLQYDRIHRLVNGDNDPFRRVSGQDRFQPSRLCFNLFIAVEDNEHHPLVFKIVHRFFKARRAVVRQGEMGPPQRRGDMPGRYHRFPPVPSQR
jgi:hypothetical protein